MKHSKITLLSLTTKRISLVLPFFIALLMWHESSLAENIASSKKAATEDISSTLKVMNFDVYAGIKSGYNSRPGHTQDVNAFLDSALLNDNTADSSSYYALHFGNNMRAMINNKTGFELAAGFQQRKYTASKELDDLNSQLRAVLFHKTNHITESARISIFKSDVEKNGAYHYFGAGYQLRNNFSKNTNFDYSLSLNNISTGDQQETHSALQVFLGMALSWDSNTTNHPTNMEFAVKTGKHVPHDIASNQGHSITSLLLSMTQHASLRWPLSLKLYSQLNYLEYAELFNEQQRTDALVELGLRIETTPLKDWELGIDVDLNKNLSTINTYDYSQTITMFEIKRYL